MSEEIAAPQVPPSPSNRDEDQHEQLPSKSTGALNNALDGDESKPIRCAKFRQQELWAWKPVWSPMLIVIMYFLVALVFIPLGTVLLVQSSNLYSTSLLRYDANGCAVGNQTTSYTPPKVCLIKLDVTKDLVKQPTYLYYGITNFYQNARTYVSSRSDPQLRGSSNPDTSTCDPLEFENGTVLNPCGLAANSQFNDSFELCKDSNCNQLVQLNGTNIAWRIDRETRFSSNHSEDFMVWMRLAAFNTWKKLYRRVEEDLERGTYWVRINSSFPVSGFGGKKFFYLAQTSWFGGPNQPLAISYLVVGCISLVISIFFGIKARTTPNLELPPETTVYLKGLVKDPVIPKQAKESVNYPNQSAI